MEFHAETEDRLRLKIEKLEKINEDLEGELQNLQTESFRRIERHRSELVSKKDEIERLRERRDTLWEEIEEWKRRFRSFEAEENTTERGLREANMELEARRQAELQAWSAVTAMVRRSAARLCKRMGTTGGGEDDEDDEKEIEGDEVVRKMVEPFAETLESMERVFEGKAEEMKMLRGKIEKAFSGKGGGVEEMDFVDVGALLSTDGGLNLD